MRYAALSDIGRRRRANQDAFIVEPSLGLFVVADGMGGHAAGEVASFEAVNSVLSMVATGRDMLAQLKDPDLLHGTLPKATRLMESAVQAATYHVYGLAENNPERSGMGTTVSALLLIDGVGITAQVGDSRVYVMRGGRASPLTEDHTLVAWQVKHGVLTEDQAARSPHRNVITRAVGSQDYVQVDTSVFDVHAGDRFLICSDGLHGYFRDEELAFMAPLTVSAAVSDLVSEANRRGGKDNITVIVIAP